MRATTAAVAFASMLALVVPAHAARPPDAARAVARYVAAAPAYADTAWQTLRDPQTGLLSTGLLPQAAFVQLYARLAAHG